MQQGRRPREGVVASRAYEARLHRQADHERRAHVQGPVPHDARRRGSDAGLLERDRLRSDDPARREAPDRRRCARQPRPGGALRGVEVRSGSRRDHDDAYRLAYTLVGNGYAVIVPDLAGYANFGAANNPPSAYAQAADVGRSTLDGSRALKQLYPQLEDKTVLVGHSQGGHSALSALALGESYGAQGTIAGVAVYAPLWLSQRTWGSVLEPGIANDRDYTIEKLAGPSAIPVWYHYTQAELLDGPGEGIKLFKAEKQAAVKQFIDGACWGEYKLLSDNATFAYELFVDSFPTTIGYPAAGLGQCNGDATCEKWVARYKADRPNLTGAAATTPILLMYGGADTTITPIAWRAPSTA